MTLGDFAKALGLALVVLALNMALAVVVVFAWSVTVEPGRDQAFYTALAPRLAAWSAPIGGALLMFGVGRWVAARRSGRNPHLFVAVVFGLYAVIDIGLGLGMAPMAELFTPLLFGSLALAGLSGQAGAFLARRRC